MDLFDLRIIQQPDYHSWYNSLCGFKDSITFEEQINYEGLTDSEKLCLYVYAWNKSEILPNKKGILKAFNWTNYKLQKVIKSLNGQISVEPAFNQETGLLSGKGYLFNKPNKQ